MIRGAAVKQTITASLLSKPHICIKISDHQSVSYANKISNKAVKRASLSRSVSADLFLQIKTCETTKSHEALCNEHAVSFLFGMNFIKFTCSIKT